MLQQHKDEKKIIRLFKKGKTIQIECTLCEKTLYVNISLIKLKKKKIKTDKKILI